ncbi:MAG: thiamine pyrophosphate-dependent enzyme, partial [Terracidiphilus sp.]
ALPILNGSGDGKRTSQGKNRKGIAAGPNASSAMPVDAFEEAAQAARDFKNAENGRVAIVFSQPANADSHWRNRLRAAASQNLPLLIVSGRTLTCGDANASASHPTQQHAAKALAFGVPVITVDGCDVRAVYRVAGESIFRARHRRGPTLIECIVPPSAGSLAVDGRQPGVVDPILNMESYLTERGILTATLKSEIQHGSSQTSNGARISQPR